MVTRDIDFLCLGAGLGGLAGALRAAALGLDTLVLERSGMVGGVAAYSGGVCWVAANHVQERTGLDDSIEEGLAYLDFANGKDVPFDRELRDELFRRAPEAYRWFADEGGIPFQSTGLNDQYWPHGPGSKPEGRILEAWVPGGDLGPWQELTRQSPHFRVLGLTQREVHDLGGDLRAFTENPELIAARQAEDRRTYGPGLAAAFVRAALVQRGVPCLLNVETTRLTQDASGRVTGAIALIDGVETEIRARCGVLIATGSYGNAPWAAQAENLPALQEGSPPVLHGDHLSLTDPTPAAIVRSATAFTVVGFKVPDATHPGTDEPVYVQVFENVGFPHSMIVNDKGKRFGDESFYGYFVLAARAWDPNAKRFTNWPCYLVCDDRFRQQYPFGPFLPGDEWPADVPRAGTLAELATLVGIDPAGLEAQADRFNADALDGHDPDFQRGTNEYGRKRLGDPNYPNPNLGPLEQPPFYAIKLDLIGLGIYSMGLSVNADGQTLTRDGRPVPGLYATGNAAAFTEQPGYVGGLANTRNMVYAFSAASHAAGSRPAPR